MKDHVIQSQFVDMTDDQIRDRLGFLWENAKRLREAAAADVQLVKLKADHKELYDERYGQDIKEYSKHLKALRKIAALKEINWQET